MPYDRQGPDRPSRLSVLRRNILQSSHLLQARYRPQQKRWRMLPASEEVNISLSSRHFPQLKVNNTNKNNNRCGGPIGLFINIRKCMVLFLNGENGSWSFAPYLDKHGETDPTLRRHHQLFLNQKRYDKLYREVWLQHLVPSTIARRLEGDNNNGGWETL